MSKPAPPPAYAAGRASTDDRLSNDGPINWLSAGFIDDKFSQNCQRAQGKPFLRTGVRPATGQRVELTILLTSARRERMPFRFSGEVVDDRASPVPGLVGLGAEGEDAVADAAAGRASSNGAPRDTRTDGWRPSLSDDDCGANGGSLALAHMVRSLIMQQQPSLLLTPEHLSSVWENHLSTEQREKISNVVVQKLGAHHGHNVLCEGRLNFDYDMRRGSEDGPWIDGIPFDGRDTWQFTLVADDSLENLWRADPSSFVNLGPAHRPRCWPWSRSDVSPHRRTGADAPLRGPGPDGAISVHICIGPHGCSGKDHPHSYQAQAA